MDVLADRYELGEVLGVGGMARVLAAHDRRLDRRVAVKLVRDELVADPVSRERLLREARAAGGLQHPNVVAVHDAGEHEGRAYIVMELVEGRTLADRLAEAGPLSAAEVVALGGAVLDALGAAHRRGLVHRDVKPGNVLLPDEGGVKLADFGIAKALGTTSGGLTATGAVLGTPRYLAPEQVAGEPATPATDLYALGAVLYECLAGHPPFEAENALATALAHQRDPVPPLDRDGSGIPPRLAAAVERALAKAPADRHPDAAAMAEALRGGEAPITDSPDPDPVSGTVPLPGNGETVPLASDEDDWLPPAGSATGTGPRRRTWLLAAGAVAAVALALVAFGVVGDTPEQAAEGEAGENGGDVTRDLDDLAADLARNPDAAGERGDELLEGILEVRRSTAGDRREDARDLMEDVAVWTADRELDPATAREALTLLEPLARPADPALAEVSGLFAEVAGDLSAWGSGGEELLGELEDLLDEDDPGDRADEARDLLEDLEEWVEDGEIDAARAARAAEVLRGLADG